MRPTLKEQLQVSRVPSQDMSSEELVGLLLPRGAKEAVKFWIFRHCKLLWCIVYWNWHDIYEGSENADQYRTWYMKLKRKLFGGNRNQDKV